MRNDLAYKLRRAIAFEQYDAAYEDCLIEQLGSADQLADPVTTERRKFWHAEANN